MSQSMNLQELAAVLDITFNDNSPLNFRRSDPNRPTVKYVDPHIDMRDGKCFSIVFRGYCGEVAFCTDSTQNANPASLYGRCITYLMSGEIT